jgi:PAS domain S-box-containing protein
MISQYNTVLIVEDDGALLRLIQKNLQRVGLHTDIAHNGAEAIARVASKPPELLLLDFRLPDMTGKQVIETLAKQQLSIPFIVITGHGDEKVAVEMMKLGARDYLVKDASFLDLFPPVVKKAIEQLTLEKQLARIEKQYQAIFENSGDAIWVQDLEGNFLTANEATARLLRLNREDLAGMNSSGFLSSESLTIFREMQKRLLQGEAIDSPYELRLIKKNGAEVIIRLTTNLLSSVSQPVGFQNIARDVTEEFRAQENLKFYAQQVIKAQEEERKRIARELHDDTAQRLIALSHQLEDFARNKSQLSLKDQQILTGLREQAKEALQEVRYFTQDLRPPILDDLGLLPALEWLTDDLKEHCGLETDLAVLGNQRRLSPEAELLLFRILQEALNNVKRHAKATRVKITIEFNKDKTKATISDNGIGFKVPKALGDLSRAGKLGLVGMDERAQLLGSSLTIESKPGSGTTVLVEAPV